MSRPAGPRLLERLVPRPSGRRRSRFEDGYVAVITAIVFSSFGFASAALGVDASRWWVEVQRIQKAADLASLAGVTYLPMDLASATTTAIDVSGRNGYPDSGSSSVDVTTGAKPSQLKVTVCSTVSNGFAVLLGISTTKLCRTAVADYTGPAPMGSPCNTFGNEPDAGSTAASPSPKGTARGSSPYANCSSRPNMWSDIQGPSSDKGNGDRFMNVGCGSSGYSGCSGSTNSEYNAQGYYFLVRVQPAATGRPIDLQLYDPEFAVTNADCKANAQGSGGLPAAINWSNTPNDYVSDAKARYSNTSATSAGTTGAPYCNGDNAVGTGALFTTSYALRQQTDTQNPSSAPVQNDTSGNACIKQFRGQTTAPSVNDLTKTSSTYDDQLAQTFHNWYSLCTFTPSRPGDYYLQVRTNISFGGNQLSDTNGNASMISTGNTNVLNAAGNTTTGGGNNSFSIRAVTPAGLEQSVSVSGYDRMPIFANADTATQIFNLIRVVPAGASKSIAFTFFDIGDSQNGSASVSVIPPADAKTTNNNTLLSAQSTSVQFPGGCRASGGYAGSGANYANCSAPITSGTNNGKLETLIIPIPNSYTCDYTSQGGCWYQVKVAFTSGTVTDTTTWTATVTGDPVRLIQ